MFGDEHADAGDDQRHAAPGQEAQLTVNTHHLAAFGGDEARRRGFIDRAGLAQTDDLGLERDHPRILNQICGTG